MAAIKLLPKDVAHAFVRQYYTILDGCPENLHRFYHESSLLGWPGPDGSVTPVTTATGISNKILASDYVKGLIDVKTIDAQNSIDGGVIVVVTGSMTLLDIQKNFSHTFFLAKQMKGFFVFNDILRYFEVSVTMTKVGDADSAGKSDQTGSTSASDTGVNDQPVSPSVTVDAAKNLLPVLPSNAKNRRAAAPAKRDSGTTESSDSAQPAFDKMPTPVAALPVNSSVKISYASMVAKEVPVLPPTAANTKQTKPSVPPTNATLKTAARLRAAPRESAPASGKGNGVKGIYIGKLPYKITEQGIVDVVKQFGAVRGGADSVKIKRHEDGFCCGFVEFESADAARRAVEAHYVWFNDRDCSYVTYKRSTRDDGGRSSSPRGSNSSRGREMEPTQKGRTQNGGRRGA